MFHATNEFYAGRLFVSDVYEKIIVILQRLILKLTLSSMDTAKLFSIAIIMYMQIDVTNGYMFNIIRGKRAIANVAQTRAASSIDDCILYCLSHIGCRHANFENGTCSLLETTEGEPIHLVNDESTTYLCKRYYHLFSATIVLNLYVIQAIVSMNFLDLFIFVYLYDILSLLLIYE